MAARGQLGLPGLGEGALRSADPAGDGRGGRALVALAPARGPASPQPPRELPGSRGPLALGSDGAVRCPGLRTPKFPSSSRGLAWGSERELLWAPKIVVMRNCPEGLLGGELWESS